MNRVLFCPPTYFDVLEVKNPFMQNAAPVDKNLAMRQWEEVRRAFSRVGFTLETIEPVPGLEDMVFSNNPVFVGVHADVGPFVVPSRMRHPSRQPEVSHYVAWFRARGYRVVELDYGEEYLEGHGDLLWDANFTHVWAGHGFRSTRGGVQKFTAVMDEMGIEVVPLELADPRFYHLDTCLAPLAPGAVLIYPGAFTDTALRAIRRKSLRIYEVNLDEALRFVCNGVSANRSFITPQLTPSLKFALLNERLEPLCVATSEFEKSGGSVCCLKLFLE
ncbi:MAG TPA: arginine deiminase-related protein [Terriglobales bacterium]|nr:arginine deiminase-related protein [Terriglobales bacterium]